MANIQRPFKLNLIAEEMNEPIEKLIPRIVEEAGSIQGAATTLGVAPNTIRYWLKKLGYSSATSQKIILHREIEQA